MLEQLASHIGHPRSVIKHTSALGIEEDKVWMA
jgi:hypothetical protein